MKRRVSVADGESYRAPRTRALMVRALLFAWFACLLFPLAPNAQQQSPELLAYDELVQLYEQQAPPTALQHKLDQLLTTPFVSNAASDRGIKHLLPTMARPGPFVRVVEEKIEEGLEYDAIMSAFTDPAAFDKLIDSKT